MKLAEILDGPEKWWGHTHRGNRQGATCLFVGLMECVGSSDIATLIREQNRLLSLLDLNDLIAGYKWNDAPERTWADIQEAVQAYDLDRALNP